MHSFYSKLVLQTNRILEIKYTWITAVNSLPIHRGRAHFPKQPKNIESNMDHHPVIGTALFCASIIPWMLQPRPVIKEEIKLKEIWLYPVKSCGGVKLNSAVIGKTGFLYDRAFMFCDNQNKFVSQRKYPRMTLINVDIDMKSATLIMTAPGMETLRIPLDYDEGEEVMCDVTVWDEPCRASEVSSAVGDICTDWIMRFLDLDAADALRLVRVSESSPRKSAPGPNHDSAMPVSFVDQYPYLLTSTTSLDYLNKQLSSSSSSSTSISGPGVQLSALNFRPNIVVEGVSTPFDEDTWKDLVIQCSNDGSFGNSTLDNSDDDVCLRCVQHCSRCTIPAIDPETGLKYPDKEPDATMKAFRLGKQLGLNSASKKNILFFGQHAIAEESQQGKTVSVGDSITILSRK